MHLLKSMLFCFLVNHELFHSEKASLNFKTIISDVKKKYEASRVLKLRTSLTPSILIYRSKP